MSFILDALKKSEIERQRQTVPGLMDTRSAARRRRLPVWAIVLGVLLGINLAVLTVVLVRKGDTPPQHSPAVERAVQASAGAAPAAAKPFSPLDAAPEYAPEIPVAAEETPAPQTKSGQPHTSETAGGTGMHSFRRPDPVLTDEDPHSDNQEVLPTINEINLSGAQALPELHLDVHVYATRPAERFVYINMRKYHEGSVLQEGPTVERIRRDGVILNYQGLRFILPRQS